MNKIIRGKAYVLGDNIDTDQIIPARFLWRARSEGYGQLLFNDVREAGGFILDRPEYKGAEVIVADKNFGCGSSREHAVWALSDAGLKVVIAPSFGDIFFNNSMKNGLLPIRLPRDVCDTLIGDTSLGGNARVTVDLERQVVVRPNGEELHFEVDPLRKHLLLNGLDDIGQTMQHESSIAGYETQRDAQRPWVPGISV